MTHSNNLIYRIFKYIIAPVILLTLFISLYLHKDTTIIKGDEAYYVGSDSCKQCHSKKITTMVTQTRSGDEAPSVKFTCHNCNCEWTNI